MPTYVPARTRKNTEVSAEPMPFKKGWEKVRDSAGSDMPDLSHAHASGATVRATCAPRKKKGRALGPALPLFGLRLDQRHFRHRAALAVTALRTRPRRAPLGLRSHRRQLVRLRRHRAVEEFKAELVAAVLVLVDDHTHMAAAFEFAE